MPIQQIVVLPLYIPNPNTGALNITYNKLGGYSDSTYYYVLVNGIEVNNGYNSADGLFSYGLNVGDYVTIGFSGDTANLEILRKDYTTDDTNDNGIKNTIIVSTVLNNSEYSFYANLSNISYNFEYNITFNQ
jgi:hypothetical protein